jgi:hypothetical protein
MRVVVALGAEAAGDTRAATVARTLAGHDGEVVALPVAGPVFPSRQLTPAEVHLVREVLVGGDTIVGYVCAGREVGGSATEGVVAVADHVGLTWDSPLRGPNDDRLGPRFPRTDGVYAPEVVQERLASGLSATISVATVAGVRDHTDLTTWEREMVDALHIRAVSSGLVPVAVIAAHLGFRLAAVVIL